MRGGGGFTLLEVVVAGGLLAVGVLALTTLQAQALQVQRRVATVRQLVAVAEAELYRSLAMEQPVGGACLGVGAGEVDSCSVVTEPCGEAVAAVCGAPGRATVVTVAVGSEGREFELSAVHAWFVR